jgi:hypothetical protein
VSSFDEFIMERCEEIITNDNECRAINDEILKIEKELIPYLPSDLKNKVLEIDESRLETRLQFMLYCF